MYVCMYVGVYSWMLITLKDGRRVGMALGEKVGERVGKVLGFAVAY